MPDFETNAERGYMGDPRRGAAMGRPSTVPDEPGAPFPHKVTLRRVYLNSGGYDSTGSYWGHGAPLYWAATDSGELDTTLRADDRDDAKAQVRAMLPGARFFN